MSDGPRVPAPLPFAKVDYDRLAKRWQELGTEPTPENSPELFADELALEGFAAAQVEPFVPAEAVIADQLDGRHAIDLALRAIRVRSVRQWLWTNRERIRLEGRTLRVTMTDDERMLLGWCRAELVKVLRDGEVLDWFRGSDSTEAPEGQPAGARAERQEAHGCGTTSGAG